MEFFQNNVLPYLLSALGVVFTGLASWLVTVITKWISSKVKDQKAATYLSTITELVFNCVNEVNQTYVEALKKEGSFSKEAQKEALDKCIEKVKSQLAPEIAAYITSNFGDLTSYITTLIESAIYNGKPAKTTTTVETVVEACED